MKRISYAVTAMAFGSLYCLFTGEFGEIAFLSAIFSVILTVSKSEWPHSMLLWAVLFYILLLPVFLGIYAELFISAIIGHFSYIVLNALEGNLNMVPSKRLVLPINLPEKALLAISFSIFLAVLVYM